MRIEFELSILEFLIIASKGSFSKNNWFSNRDSSIYGTPMSMPPEVYNSNIIKSTQIAIRKQFGKSVSSSAFNFGMARDVWSLGVLLYD